MMKVKMRKLYALTDNQAQFIKARFPRAQIGDGIAPFTKAECDALDHFLILAEAEAEAIDFGKGFAQILLSSKLQWRAMRRGSMKIFRLSLESLNEEYNGSMAR